MRKYHVVLGLAFFVTACANDHYTVIPGGNGSQERMAADLAQCKQDVLDRYYHDQHQSGAIVGGVLGGAVGGAIGGAVDAGNTPDHPMKLSDLDPAIERCMYEHGYTGTSEN